MAPPESHDHSDQQDRESEINPIEVLERHINKSLSLWERVG
jgi:hypothetical protein